MSKLFEPGDEVKALLEKAEFVLEATNSERQLLWGTRVHRPDPKAPTPITWESDNSGWLPPIGTFNRRQICMSVRIITINGIPVLVWELTSMLADYKMAEEWLTKYCKAYRECRRCDAANFHQIVHYAYEKAKSATATTDQEQPVV